MSLLLGNPCLGLCFQTAEGREHQEGPQEAGPKDRMLWEDAPLAPGDWSPLQEALGTRLLRPPPVVTWGRTQVDGDVPLVQCHWC